ncbi:MAG: hypothetical protein K2X81_06430 [Candidatus Obscuribacterales bacterium]|nr:hypothetical protein [Candidatus Obscuribacterales bacterium]
MKRVHRLFALAFLASGLLVQAANAQDFLSTNRSSERSIDNFNASLDATAANMARSYDERCAQAAYMNMMNTAASNMYNQQTSDQFQRNNLASQIYSNNGTNQGAQNQGNNQGNNGFFGGSILGGGGWGVGLPLAGFGGGGLYNSTFGRNGGFNTMINNDQATRQNQVRSGTRAALNQSAPGPY